MEQENSDFIAVYAPRLHAGLVPPQAPSAVQCFDPGLGQKSAQSQDDASPQRGCFRPESLPLDASQAKAWLRSMLTWGMQFDSPGQIAAIAAAEALHKQRDVGGMAPDELAGLRQFASGAPFRTPPTQEQDREKAALLQAQLQLLLAWNLEERSMELSYLGQGLASQYERFGQALGLEQDEEATESGLVKPVALDEGDELLPRLDMVCALLAFMPPGGCLYSEDAYLVSAWLEQGVVFAGLDELGDVRLEQTLAGEGEAKDIQAARVPGWRLAGCRGPLAEMPWLEQEFLAAFRARD